MELPWNCKNCGFENMVDMDHLSEWPLDKIVTALGYVCEHCGAREAVSHQTASLKDAERRLIRYRPGQRQFENNFRKLVRKAEGLNRRGDFNGALHYPNMAIP